MANIVVVGGGWAGVASALSAAKSSAEVILIEKSNQILGTGLVGGIFRNNGRYTAAEEATALGFGELFAIMDNTSRHININFPGHEHSSLYDVTKIEMPIMGILEEMGVNIRLQTRASDVVRNGNRITELVVDIEDRNRADAIKGDVFIDATGTAGPQKNCTKFGNGCVMCILRCPSFGPRISLAEKLGIKEVLGGSRKNRPGAMSGACEILKESLSEDICDELHKKGVAIVPLPGELRNREGINIKVCQQYADDEYVDNLIFLDTGHAKLMTTYYPLEFLRKIPGCERIIFLDPYAGGKGNSIRLCGITLRENTMRAQDSENLFVAGEKAGPLIGHTEAIITGMLAGYNAVQYVNGAPQLVIPDTLAIGDFISYTNDEIHKGTGLWQKFTFSGSAYFKRMKELGLYSIDKNDISKRVESCGMLDFFSLRKKDMYDLVIRNGRILDGTSNPWFKGKKE